MSAQVPTETTLHGGFSIWQDGVKVASGSGPYERIRSEAEHYAAVYRQEGPVKVRVYKFPVKIDRKIGDEK